MNEEELKKLLHPGGAKQGRAGAYSAKDFQLDVLGQLGEMHALAQELRDALPERESREQEKSTLLRFDGRTLVAIGAIALSLTGYVLQDARNTTKRDAEIDSATARIGNLEKLEATNTEGRIRTEVELEELRQGQAEIMTMLEAPGSTSRKVALQRSASGAKKKEPD